MVEARTGWSHGHVNAEFYAGSGTVTVNNSENVGNITFDAGTNYTINGPGQLNLTGNFVMNSGGTATIAGPMNFGGTSAGWPILNNGTVQINTGGSWSNIGQLDLGAAGGQTATLASPAAPWLCPQ